MMIVLLRIAALCCASFLFVSAQAIGTAGRPHQNAPRGNGDFRILSQHAKL